MKTENLSNQLDIVEKYLTNSHYKNNEFDSPAVNAARNAQQELNDLKQKITELENQVKVLTPDSKYKAIQYKYKNEEKLSPPSYQPSQEEIQLAKARYVLENDIWDIIYYLDLYIKVLNGKDPRHPYTKEILEKEAELVMNKWNKAMNKWDNGCDILDAMIDNDWFKKCYVDSLSDFHGGDCTAVACSCSRCHAEQIFKIPATANWSKAEGWKLYNEYLKDVEEKKSLKSSVSPDDRVEKI